MVFKLIKPLSVLSKLAEVVLIASRDRFFQATEIAFSQQPRKIFVPPLLLQFSTRNGPRQED